MSDIRLEFGFLASPPMKLIKKLSIGLLLALVLYLGFGMYSMFWSENLLRPVKNGMSESEVREVIGAPVSIINRGNGTSMWDYNRWSGQTRSSTLVQMAGSWPWNAINNARDFFARCQGAVYDVRRQLKPAVVALTTRCKSL
jgi:hypothetical protein